MTPHYKLSIEFPKSSATLFIIKHLHSSTFQRHTSLFFTAQMYSRIRIERWKFAMVCFLSE
jgi:hypothetical protein